eukprot:CAMPEP_0197865832 /NCGR_PEP_ID=MMETSP1438-20131217/43885_1 /TAXON_ID=1461541 /ORGANISM="Pterosperma sp., Strain CCMP1384" /LENGTH=44 /DNA_ID= /DNA_START= /DNA_END= /DNA_ORIENTATION=
MPDSFVVMLHLAKDGCRLKRESEAKDHEGVSGYLRFTSSSGTKG